MEILIFKAVLFVLALLDGIYLGVLIHELGHAVMALLVTRQTVKLKVGRSREPFKVNWGRLSMELGIAGFWYGSTSYDRSRESASTQRWVVVGGPLASFVATVAFGASLWQFEPWGWIWIALMAFFVANVRILITALWPMEYPNPHDPNEIWLSDSLDFWRLGKR